MPQRRHRCPTTVPTLAWFFLAKPLQEAPCHEDSVMAEQRRGGRAPTQRRSSWGGRTDEKEVEIRNGRASLMFLPCPSLGGRSRTRKGLWHRSSRVRGVDRRGVSAIEVRGERQWNCGDRQWSSIGNSRTLLHEAFNFWVIAFAYPYMAIQHQNMGSYPQKKVWAQGWVNCWRICNKSKYG
jgi:hypothetical protein